MAGSQPFKLEEKCPARDIFVLLLLHMSNEQTKLLPSKTLSRSETANVSRLQGKDLMSVVRRLQDRGLMSTFNTSFILFKDQKAV